MSNITPFVTAMREVAQEDKQREALGFKVLSAMLDMESTFHVDYLKDFHARKDEKGHQAKVIRESLTELMGSFYTDLCENAAIPAKETRQDVAKRTKKEDALRSLMSV